VAVAVLNGSTQFELAVGYEVFGVDRTYLTPEWYEFRHVAAEPGPIRTEGGFILESPYGLDALDDADTIIVPACNDGVGTAQLRDALVAAHRRGARIASICTGAFILAAAGLLDGKRATTHWKATHELAARCPDSRIEPDAIYVRDGSTYTSAGVTAGIDLALALLEEDHGPELTREVARALVVYMQRSGGQSQFSAPLRIPPPRSPALRKVIDLVTANPGEDYSLAVLAGHLNVSTRHLTRLFRDELSTTPARYIENIRFDLARALLDQGQSATQAAALAGFPSYESMRRVFARKLSITPATYQRRFSSARSIHPE
jgi:transcriptional regulator GlxA family with amidase domain